MLNLTKLFIEENIKLLDTDLDKFIRKGVSLLRDDAREELIEVLRTIKVLNEDLLDALLINKLGFVFPTVEDKTNLNEFIDWDLMRSGIKTYFGKTKLELCSFIIRNSENWSDDMFLDKDAFNTPIIRTDLR